MKRIVAILETMWDWRGMTSGAGYRQAPRYFRINPKNFSGRRLYKLIGQDAKLLVTNASPELVSGPEHHGKGDSIWLRENLMILDGVGGTLRNGGVVSDSDGAPFQVLLVCGKIAQDTYRKCGYVPRLATVIEMPHPAARMWNHELIARYSHEIQSSRDVLVLAAEESKKEV